MSTPAALSPTAVLGVRSTLGAYLALTKPRIIELLLITTVPAMVAAAGGWPGSWLVVATLVGGTLSAGGANALNNYHDRDIDQIMRRTSRRPLVRNSIAPEKARLFGWSLGLAGFVWLWAFTNLMAALLATAALLFYVFVYTLALKRNTEQNIVIGGAAGAAPVLVGWAAVAGAPELGAWVMFAVVFAWTPPHFWALALRYKDDYALAGVPMMPVVRGVERTTRQMLSYAVVTALFSLFLVPTLGLGWVYLIAAVVLNAWLVIQSARVVWKPERAMLLFGYSTVYLAALFGALTVDRLL